MMLQLFLKNLLVFVGLVLVDIHFFQNKKCVICAELRKDKN